MLFMKTIYLDHAATTPVDNRILTKILPFYTENFGNADSPHAAGRKSMNAVDEARDTLANLWGVKANEVYFTSGGTESDNWALIGGARAAREKGKDQVIISAIEHHAVLSAAAVLEKEGFAVVYLPVNEGGRVEPNALKNALTERTGIVTVMAVNNETGAIQPIRELAELTHAQGAVFFTDCVQAAPYMPITPKEWGVDMLSVSAHKLYGLKGCGALYIRSGVKVKGLIVGGEQERGLRGGTTNVPAVVAMGEAYKLTALEMQSANEKIQALRTLFLQEIAGVEGVTVNGEGLPAVLNLRVQGVNAVDMVYAMDLRGVCIAAGSACASASIKPSHVLLAMGLTEAQAKECVRVSFGKNNTEEEIRTAARIFTETVKKLRG